MSPSFSKECVKNRIGRNSTSFWIRRPQYQEPGLDSFCTIFLYVLEVVAWSRKILKTEFLHLKWDSLETGL